MAGPMNCSSQNLKLYVVCKCQMLYVCHIYIYLLIYVSRYYIHGAFGFLVLYKDRYINYACIYIYRDPCICIYDIYIYLYSHDRCNTRSPTWKRCFHRKTDRRQDWIRFYRANVAELLHAERVCHLLTEVCFGDPGLGFQPSDLDPDLTARVLLRGASWPRLLSGYEEIEPAPGWRHFGVMKRKRAPFRWELLRAAEHQLLY